MRTTMHSARIAGLLLCLFATPLGADSRQGTDPAVVRLLEYVQGAKSLSSAGLLDLLVPLGPNSVPELLSALDHGSRFALPNTGTELVLEDRTRQLFASALAGIPETAARLARENRASEDSRLARNRVGLALLRAKGSAAQLPLAVELATPRAPGSSLDSSTKSLFDETSRAMFARDPAVCRTVPNLLPSAHHSVQVALIHALGATPVSDALDALARILNRPSVLHATVLAQIGRLAGHPDVVPSPQAFEATRESLGSADPAARREAASAAGKLDDTQAVSRLIKLLEDEHEGVRENALWSLREISGVGLRLDPTRWARWYEEQERWWQFESTEVLGLLSSGDAHDASAAARKVSGHRLFRARIAPSLTPLLRSRDLRLVHSGCSALASLRATTACPDLIELLEHADQSVRVAAWQALRAITGRDLPIEQAAWSQP